MVRWLVRCISRLAPIYREAPYVLWRFHGAEVGLWGGSRGTHGHGGACTSALLALIFWNLRAALYLCVSFIPLFVCASALRPSLTPTRGEGPTALAPTSYMHEPWPSEERGEAEGEVGATLLSLC